LPEPAPLDRLRRRADFKAASGGRRAHAGLLTLQARDRADGEPLIRLGFTITRKVGTAVERNRIRRRLRVAAPRVAEIEARPGHDYVIVARRGLIDAPFETVLSELAAAFARVHKTDAARKGPQISSGTHR
jgi:ribonuclease P protein component